MKPREVETIWEYSSQTEALRLLQCSHQIAKGFFKVNNFIVLPYPVKPFENIVSFPDLPYLTIRRFWEKAKRINIKTTPTIKLTTPKYLMRETIGLLEEAKLPKPNYLKVKKLWEKHQDKIIAEIYKIIPEKAGSIASITIWPTAFGTNCSFSLCEKPPHHITIWLREDQGIAAIVEAILTSLTRLDVYNGLNGLWSESEIIVDWLLAYSSLRKIIEPFDPKMKNFLTIKATRDKQQATLLEKSRKFLTKIGAPSVDVTTIKNLKLNNLSPNEKKIQDLLISHFPNIVTTDEIADILFANNEDAFSLEAIAKTIQRLRDKLELNGISGSFIQTKRGEGYLLVN